MLTAPTSSPSLFFINESEYAETERLMRDKFPLMLQGYMEDAQRYYQQLEQALEQESYEAVIAQVHPLKSSSASLGLTSVAILAEEVESLAIMQQDWGQLRAICEPLHREVVLACDYLQRKLQEASHG